MNMHGLFLLSMIHLQQHLDQQEASMISFTNCELLLLVIVKYWRPYHFNCKILLVVIDEKSLYIFVCLCGSPRVHLFLMIQQMIIDKIWRNGQ